MRTSLVAVVFYVVALASVEAQPASTNVVGTWTATAGCRHGGGETLTLRITRDADGTWSGATDWARSTSDGRRGRPEPFTTLDVEGSRIMATRTANGRTARLDATVDGDTIKGGWAVDGDDDRWTFAGKRQAPSGSGEGPR